MYLKMVHFWIVVGIAVVMLGLSAWHTYAGGIFMGPEAGKYFAHYLSRESVIVKIFDYGGTDLVYRARELGNVFNFLDAEFILLTIRLGVGNMLSVTYYVCVLLLVLVHYRFTQKHFGRAAFPVFIVLALLFLASPGVFYSGFYFRTSKIIVSFLTTILFWIFYETFDRRPRQFLLAGLLAFAMMITDELGIAVSAGAAAVATGFILLLRKKQFVPLLVSLAAALAAAHLWRTVVGPYLTMRVTGEYPQLWTIDGVPAWDWATGVQSVRTFLYYLSLLFGNTGAPGVILIFSLTMLAYIKAATRWVTRVTIPIIFLSGVAMCIGTVYLMSLKHVYFFLPEQAVVYYPLPFQTLWFLVVSLACFLAGRKFPTLYPVMTGVVGIFFVLNVFFLPSAESILKHSRFYMDYYNLSAPMIRAIRDPAYPLAGFTVENQQDAIRVMRQRLIE